MTGPQWTPSPLDNALYETPDYVPAGSLPDTRAGLGDPVPLAIRMRRSLPGDPVGRVAPVTITNTVATLVPVDDGTSVMLQVTGAPMRYTLDGTDPSGTVGFRADPTTILMLTGRPTTTALRMIREGGTDVTLIVQHFS